VPEERKATAYVLRLTRSVLVDGTKAEIEYYARLDEVDQVVIDEELKITNWPDPLPGPVCYPFEMATTVATVKSYLGADVTVTDLNGNVLTDDAIVGNGYQIDDLHTIVVKGDFNSDGMVSAIDYLGLITSIAKGENLTDHRVLAADVNEDGIITAADSLAMKNMLRK